MRRASRVDKQENAQFLQLEGLYQGILNCPLKDKLTSLSEEEFWTEATQNGIESESAKNFQFIGDLHVRYDGLSVVASSIKARRSPLFPLFGGKRAYLLLENGRVVKLKGASEVEGFFARVKTARKYFRSNVGVSTNAPDAMNSVPPKVLAFLNISRRTALGRATLAVSFVVLFGIVIVSLFFSDPLSLELFGSWDFFVSDLPTYAIAIFLAEVVPYWIVVSNYFAEY